MSEVKISGGTLDVPITDLGEATAGPSLAAMTTAEFERSFVEWMGKSPPEDIAKLIEAAAASDD